MKKMMMILALLFAMVGSSFGAGWNVTDPWNDATYALSIKSYHVVLDNNGDILRIQFLCSDNNIYMFSTQSFTSLAKEQNKAMLSVLMSVKATGQKINVFREPTSNISGAVPGVHYYVNDFVVLN